MARPSSFTQTLADEICSRLIEGESLRSICRDDVMPAIGTVCRWLTVNEKFQEQYTRAREFQADTLADEIIDIADNANNDWMERLSDDEKTIGWTINGEHIQRSRLRVDARKWSASKLKPKKYGDKSTVELGGIDGKAIEIKSTPDDELNSRILELTFKAGKGRAAKAFGRAKKKGDSK